jgi:hypothetical protein
MAIQVKALANGQLGTTSQGDLYTVPAAKTTIVKNIRLANTDTAARTLNLWFKRSGGTSRLISPSAMTLAAGSLAIDDQELTMEAGDKVQGDASVANKIDYVISGVERDVS